MILSEPVKNLMLKEYEGIQNGGAHSFQTSNCFISTTYNLNLHVPDTTREVFVTINSQSAYPIIVYPETGQLPQPDLVITVELTLHLTIVIMHSL